MNPRSSLLPSGDSERAFLGACVLDPTILDRTRIRPEHLAREKHSVLLRIMLDLRKSNRLGTYENLIATLDASRDLEQQVGGMGYMTGHASDAAIPELVPWVERNILEAFHKRSIKEAAQESINGVMEGENARVIDAKLRARLDAVRETGDDRCEAADAVARRVWERQNARLASGRTSYISTGWREWDGHQDWQGWSSEGVTYILARSGMGKTSFLNSTAVAMAAAGIKVVIHGTETSRDARVEQMAHGSVGIVPKAYQWLRRLRAEGRATAGQDEELERVAALERSALEWVGRLPLRVSGAGLTVEDLSAEVSRLVFARLCDVLVVDYLQDFVVSKGVKVGDKVAQVNHASTALKTLSAIHNIPIICGTQVSGEKDGIPKDIFPEQWDIQWSSGAHQDAEEIYALNRGEFWRDRLGDRGYNPERHGRLGVVDVQARKRRSGRLALLSLPWDGPTRWVGVRPHADVACATAAPNRWADPDEEE